MPDLDAAPPTVGQVGIFELIRAFQKMLKRFDKVEDIREIVSDQWTVSSKIDYLLELLPLGARVKFDTLFTDTSSRTEMIVTFLAMLELIKLNHLQVEQEVMLGEIVVVRPEAA